MSNKGSPSPSPEAPSDTQAKLEGRSESPKADTESPDSNSHSPTIEEQEKSREASSSTSAQPEESASQANPVPVNAHVQGDWQAVWSSQHNAYYFYNMRTNETTWTNPLAEAPEASGSSWTGADFSGHYDPAAAALAQGIDPELAFLDPSLVAGPSNPAAFTYAAKFNARTGAFAKPDARNPDHVSEYERMKRMSSAYFDMDAWQQEVEKRYAEEEEVGKKRKKPTKKDLDMYKERKKQKKLAKTAWLRT